MTFRWRAHTADLRLVVKGKNRETVFRDSLAAVAAALRARPRGGAALTRVRLRLRAPDTTALLVDFLGEALARMQVEKMVFTGVRFQQLTDRSLNATAMGRPVVSFGRDVKAITYHEAAIEKRAGGDWSATLVLDI